MRRVIALAVVLILPTFSVQASGSHSIRGHVTKRGTYVAPSHATNPDHSKINNWSSRGNINPYTGKKGTRDPLTSRHR